MKYQIVLELSNGSYIYLLILGIEVSEKRRTIGIESLTLKMRNLSDRPFEEHTGVRKSR